MAKVRLEGITKSYGDFVALRDIDLEIGDGKFVTLLGASGSGKTTCLRIVAGFLYPDTGRIIIGDEDVTDVPPYRRNTGMVFQQYALFPHLTVAENVAYGLKVRKLSSSEIKQRTSDALRLVHLDQFKDRYPRQLSGGQMQRVALARAVVIRPRILLLDEPLAALDLKLRQQLQLEIRAVQQELGITALFVTHDQSEALSISDYVVVMRGGEILQMDQPTRLYKYPQSLYVANFVGHTNLLKARVIDRGPRGEEYVVAPNSVGGSRFVVLEDRRREFATGTECYLGFRPEAAQFGSELPNRISVTIEDATFSGDSWTVKCQDSSGEKYAVQVPSNVQVPDIGSIIDICWAPDSCFLLKDEDEALEIASADKD